MLESDLEVVMDYPMDYMHQELLQRLESIRVNINWENGNERIEFPKNLCDIFRPEEIDWLLIEEAKTKSSSPFFRIPLDEILIRSGYRDEPEVDEDGEPLLRRTTALLWVAKHKLSTDNCKIKIRNLFAIYHRFDVNYTDDGGWTHFHVACVHGLDEVVEKFLELGQDPDCRPREENASTIDPPLHLALKHKQKRIFELLLRRGANPNLADAEGLTPLHIICMNSCDDHELVRILFEISEEQNQPVQLDAKDKLGWTPLHLALNCGNKKVAESLLINGADPNEANAKGLTPLHVICNKSYENYMAMTFFRTISVIQETVNVDAQDVLGDTPLHLASRCGNKKKVEMLLKNGADPNLINNEGSTPLHVICKRFECHNDDLVKLFFKINHENRRFVQVDAVDNLDRTPLQLAVANLIPNAIDILLDNGVNLSGFVFPTEIYFGEAFKPELNETSFCDFKLKLASRALAVVERLQERGYELVRSDAVTVMNFFANHGMFKKLADVEKSWYNDEKFVRELKNITIEDNDKSPSLYDLIRSRRVQAELTYADYLKFAHSKKLEYLSGEKHRKVCISLLCETMLRRFCRKWAASSMWEVTRSRMPLNCRDIIAKYLENKDLWHICLVARGPRS